MVTVETVEVVTVEIIYIPQKSSQLILHSYTMNVNQFNNFTTARKLTDLQAMLRRDAKKWEDQKEGDIGEPMCERDAKNGACALGDQAEEKSHQENEDEVY